MKYLSLHQAMLGMRVIQIDTGTIIKSPAGSAEYDLKGRRRKVNGNAEYFPAHFRVKDKRKPKLTSMTMTDEGITLLDANGTVRVRLGSFGEKGGIHTDKAFIEQAMIQPASIAVSAIEEEARERNESLSQPVCVPSISLPAEETIEQHTLSAVLSSALHLVDADQAGDVAVKLAQAVKSAFQVLNFGFHTGGYVSKDAIEEAVIKSTAQLTDNISLLNSMVHQLQVTVSHARTR